MSGFSITIGAAVTAATMLVSFITAYYTNIIQTTERISTVQAAFTEEINDVRIDTQANKTNIENIENRLNRIEDKIDVLLVRDGVNPLSIQ